MIIDSQDVKEFKDVCNENYIIPKILKEKLSNYFLEPILDVGSGIGEIMTRAFPEKIVNHIDIDDFSRFMISDHHSREIISFFDYKPKEKIGTMLMSHVLQFIDDDISELNKKISQISPEYLIDVANTNKDIMGDLLIWFKENIGKSNPEESIPGFPDGYELVQVEPFTAEVVLPDFDKLATQVSYLFDIELTSSQKEGLAEFLRSKCEKPTFTVDEEIRVYKKIKL